jgi:hypothetical protein
MYLAQDESAVGLNRYNPRRILLCIVLFGLLIRIAWMVYARPVPVSDFEHYRQLAESLLDHGQFGYPKPSAFRLPGYPAFLALLMLVSRSVVWLSLCNVLLSTFAIVVVYYFAYHITSGNTSISVISAALCAVNPSFVLFSPVLASEHLFAILLFGGLWLLYRRGRRTFIHTTLASVLLGCAVLTRGEGLFYIPVFLFVIYLMAENRKYAVRCILICLMTCLIIIGSWCIRNMLIFRCWVGLSTTVGVTFYFSHNPNSHGFHSLAGTDFYKMSEVDAQKSGFKMGWDYLKEKPSRLLRDIERGTITLYAPSLYALYWSLSLPKSPTQEVHPAKPLRGRRTLERIAILFYVFLVVTAALSLILYRRIPLATWVLLFSILIGNWICYGVIFCGDARYRYPCEIIFSIMAAVTICNLLACARDSDKAPSNSQ